MSADDERLERLLNLMRGRVRNRTPGQMPLWSAEVGYLVNEIDRLRTLEAETLRLARIGAEAEAGIDGRIQALEGILGELWLYVNWRYCTKQLTRDQKHLWADTVDRWSSSLQGDTQQVADRWWAPDAPVESPQGDQT